jgi:putative ABC transport system permease protein
VFRDLLFRLRSLIKRPALSAVAVTALALGIGSTTAIFSVADFVLLRSLPYQDPGRLVSISRTSSETALEEHLVSATDFIDLRDQNQSFTEMAGVSTGLPTVNTGGDTEQVLACSVTANYFSLLGAQPAMGRTFSSDDDQPGRDHVLVASYAFWKSHLGADPDVVGRTITVGTAPYTIAGVMPRGFIDTRPDEYKPAAFWTPRRLQYDPRSRGVGMLGAVARLKPATSIDRAQQDVDSIAGAIERQSTDTRQDLRIRVDPLHEHFVRQVRPAVYSLLGAVGFLLLISCANVANLLLGRAAEREREMAIRTALGAGRRRLLQQSLMESLILALAGGVLGILVSQWTLGILVRIGPQEIPRLGEIKIDGRVLAFSLGVSLFAGIVAGMLPALRVSGGKVVAGLKNGFGGGSGGRRTRRTGNILAAIEIAVSMILLVGAGLMVNSFVRLQRVTLGFDPERLLVFEIALPPSKYPAALVAPFFTDLKNRIAALPGVERAAVASDTPVMGANRAPFEVEGSTQPGDTSRPEAGQHYVSSEYFTVVKTPLIQGRAFDESDTQLSRPVAIVNEMAARRYWQGRDPVGTRINIGEPNAPKWVEVVGVAGDIRTSDLTSELSPEVYYPATQVQSRAMSLIIRTASDPLLLAPAVRSTVHEVDSQRPLWNLTTMQQLIRDSVARPRFNTLLMLIFAIIAVILALMGIYGVFSYSVTERTREIGIRMALGAERVDVLRMVVRQGLLVAVTGVAAGVAGALILTRTISTMLFEVTAVDPVTFAICTILMIAVALAATTIPASRASRTDPMVALRHE